MIHALIDSAIDTDAAINSSDIGYRPAVTGVFDRLF